MEQGPLEETLIRRARARRAPAPEKIRNAPVLAPGNGFYFQSFINLSSCRSSGMGEGPISWLSVYQYGRALDLTDEEIEDLWFLTSKLDGEYLKYRAQQAKNNAKIRD